MRFGHIEDVEAYYAKIEASAAYAKLFEPDADTKRQARIEANRVRRVRRPTLRSVVVQAKRAGIEVGQVAVASDGTITVTPGKPIEVRHVEDSPALVNDWSVL